MELLFLITDSQTGRSLTRRGWVETPGWLGLKITILGERRGERVVFLNVSFMVNLAKCYITLSLWSDIQCWKKIYLIEIFSF